MISRRGRGALLASGALLAVSACADREIRLRDREALISCDEEGTCPDALLCDPETATCVECIVDTDCQSTRRQFCIDGECAECHSDADCNEWDPYCDLDRYRCVECRSDADCDTSDPVCNPRSGECVECLSDEHCSGDARCDEEEHECRA